MNPFQARQIALACAGLDNIAYGRQEEGLHEDEVPNSEVPPQDDENEDFDVDANQNVRQAGQTYPKQIVNDQFSAW